MIALKIFPIAQILLILFTDLIICYPSSFYDSKRFSRSSHRASYDPYDQYNYYARSQQYPYGYYPRYATYPFEYYYGDDTYPVYYVAHRTPKYDLLPYYYQDVPVTQNKYNYYNYGDLTGEDQERLLQEIEREQRERSQPIGHEIKYENDYNVDDEGSLDDTNAAFLNNLMMQQMYQESVKEKLPSNYPEQNPYSDYSSDESDSSNIAKWDDIPYDRPVNFEDEEVKELRELPKKQKQRKNRQRKQRKPKIANENPSKRSEEDNMIFTDRKPVIKDILPTALASSSTEGARRDVRGQKEEVLLRPATPVRHPFSSSVLDMLNQEEEKKRSPSVYDTIRRMLEMDKKYEESQAQGNSDTRASMQKRIISSEDSLTRQLSVLKKAK